jgi:hypothetical protein
MTRPTVEITNCETKEVIVREMNDEEYADYLSYAEKIKVLDEANAARQASE